MSDYFNCPRCGYAPKPSDPRARNEGVCDSCWTDLYIEEWYETEGDYQRRRQNQQRQDSQQNYCK